MIMRASLAALAVIACMACIPAVLAQTQKPLQTTPGAASRGETPVTPGETRPSVTRPGANTAARTGESPVPFEAEVPPPPYEPQLLRLAEIMGALAFLRPLCGAADGPEWRARMTDLIEAEATAPQRRDRMAGAFNKGYRSFALVYRGCTASAQLATGRYLRESGILIRELKSRYGG